MSARSLSPIYARLGDRELPVRWAWFRPEPQVGDTVRIPTGPGGDDGWRSFRVVAKRLRADGSRVGAMGIAGAPTGGAIDLDVEPLAYQD
jgi:hypothetical protein